MKVKFSDAVPKTYRFQLAWVISNYFQGKLDSPAEVTETARRRGLPVTGAWAKNDNLYIALDGGERKLYLRCQPDELPDENGKNIEEVEDDGEEEVQEKEATEAEEG